jgi:hypothetical protein
MNLLLQILLALCALVVVAEGLNKLERAAPREPGLTTRQRVSEWLKGLAWCLLTLGAGIYLAAVLLQAVGLFELLASKAGPLVLAGFAVLIVRTRVKEG